MGKFIIDKKKGNVIHGSNAKAYIPELSKEFKKEIYKNFGKVKKKILNYTTDDLGNAQLFLDIFGKYVIFNTTTQTYFHWTGRVWNEDSQNIVELWAQAAMEARRTFTVKQLEKCPGHRNYTSLLKHAKSCCNRKDISALIELMRSRVSYDMTKFAAKPHLLNVLNGTIDLKNNVLMSHRYDDYITQMVPFVFKEDAKSERFEEFLSQTFKSKEMIEYIQRLLGYCITGETSEQSIYFAYGKGANGKSTLLALVRHIMSNYATVISSKTLISSDKSGAANSEIAQLPLKRLVSCSELNETDMLNEGRVKAFSGGDTLPARENYGRKFTFKPMFKCIVDTNYLPLISGTDYGIWRRINVIPFYNTIGKKNIDKQLPEELKRHSKAVLTWLVKGAIDYYRYGLFTPEIIERETKEYRKTQNTIGSFIDACIVESKGSCVRANELYSAYVKFCNQNLISPCTSTKFGRDFAALGYIKDKDRVSRKYLDIELNMKEGE